MYFVMAHIERGRFRRNLVGLHSYGVNFLQNHVNDFHLPWIMSLHYLVKLKCSSCTCYHWVVKERNFRIYFTLTVASKFASWLQSVRNIAGEGVQNTHNWSGLHWNSDWERSGPSWMTLSVRQPSSVASSIHNFAANLGRKQRTKFHQNRLSFIEDITFGHILVSFFPDIVYIRNWCKA